MMRLATSICALTVGAACVLGSCSAIFFQNGVPLAMSGKSAHKTGVLTVFLTGNELGELKPCGCSGGQLGGLDRREAVFGTVPALKRVIVDTGSFVEGDSEQDEIKFNVIVFRYRKGDITPTSLYILLIILDNVYQLQGKAKMNLEPLKFRSFFSYMCVLSSYF